MAYETKDNTGSMFNNDRKEKDMHPDRTGQCRIGGVDYWVSGWIKQDRNGKPYLSLSFKRKDQVDRPTQSGAKSAQNRQGAGPGADMDDQIPFAAEFR